jgi:hypothetical protein
MSKILFTLLILSASVISNAAELSTSYFNDSDFIISRKKDTLKNDTMFLARRMGNELKFILNREGDFGVLFNDSQHITVKSNGNVGLGTKNPQYRLDVCGSIRASAELMVETNEWCDFVFRADYVLQPFEQRIEQIKENEHLPYIRPESEITESGIPVSETLTGLLRNVEELYLYIEQLEQRITQLEEENQKLKTQQ